MIVVDCRYIRTRPSGIAPYVQALVDHLPALAPDLRFAFVKHPEAPARLTHADNAREVVFPFEATGPVTMWLMPTLLGVEWRQVSLFHATFNILPAGLPVPAVTTIMDLMWLEQAAWCRQPGPWGHIETAYYHHGIRRALSQSVRIATISEASREAIARVSPAAARRTTVAPLGVSEEFRPMATDDDRAMATRVREKFVPGARRYVLTVGQNAGYKNHAGVIRSFARAFRDDPSTHLALVQRLRPGSELGPLVRSLGLDHRVHFLTGLDFVELRALYWGALALCHPSLCEGFGNPPAEAIAAGCPVVTSNRSSMPEVAGEAGLLVDPEDDGAIADALRRVAQEEGLADAMRARGLVRAQRFRWRACAEQTLAIYRAALADLRRAPARKSSFASLMG
ncbi:MAG: glycosyltransferase family 4 protein [Myxococcales bacterium]|nr:glycosyltransferase family 4 protein [Myxococcales bacterium]